MMLRYNVTVAKRLNCLRMNIVLGLFVDLPAIAKRRPGSTGGCHVACTCCIDAGWVRAYTAADGAG